MKYSVPFWVISFLIGELLKFIPLCSSILAVRVLVWYVISQAVKHFIFRSCSFWIRFPQGGKTVLVTGASAGIGAATAEDLCARALSHFCNKQKQRSSTYAYIKQCREA
ncbi:hypothetical protein D917_06397 [Trichinella nativa]|uniref:Uncharacterized protein n=1 Tax=Trichinella nativa TaxID=6335 RepID=A0A1Y3ESK0_9BILA|nr:hypothetical protein D917_06397 [Trichinella nativa]